MTPATILIFVIFVKIVGIHFKFQHRALPPGDNPIAVNNNNNNNN
jgi:hypothetical protein